METIDVDLNESSRLSIMKNKLAFLYPLIAIILWSGNVIVSRMSAHTIGPQAMTFYRLLFAVPLMSTFVAVPAWRNRAVIWPRIGQFAILRDRKSVV